MHGPLLALISTPLFALWSLVTSPYKANLFTPGWLGACAVQRGWLIRRPPLGLLNAVFFEPMFHYTFPTVETP